MVKCECADHGDGMDYAIYHYGIPQGYGFEEDAMLWWKNSFDENGKLIKPMESDVIDVASIAELNLDMGFLDGLED
jgi:hypothetical protein